MAQQHNLHRGKGSRARQPWEFLPDSLVERPRQTVADLKSAFVRKKKP